MKFWGEKGQRSRKEGETFRQLEEKCEYFIWNVDVL
jgi:hypothetical protein